MRTKPARCTAYVGRKKGIMREDRIKTSPFACRRLVEEYTASNLSYPEDILDAFAGLVAVLRSELVRNGHNGALLHGIPEHKIENYLL